MWLVLALDDRTMGDAEYRLAKCLASDPVSVREPLPSLTSIPATFLPPRPTLQRDLRPQLAFARSTGRGRFATAFQHR